MTVRLTREFTSTGIDARTLQAMERKGTLVHVRRGAFSDSAQDDARGAHRELIEGTWPLLGANAVLSHGSAAALHGLPLWGSLLQKVSVTRPTGGHGVRRPYLHVWRAPLSVAEVATKDGFRLTSLERTTLDVARQLPYERAVAVLDAALHLGADPGLLDRILLDAAGRKGVPTARVALAFADKLAESVGESISRVRMAEVGLPAPVLQFEVFSQLGAWVARTDFWWREQRVVGEFDGRVKYTGPAGEVADVVLAEKGASRRSGTPDSGSSGGGGRTSMIVWPSNGGSCRRLRRRPPDRRPRRRPVFRLANATACCRSRRFNGGFCG